MDAGEIILKHALHNAVSFGGRASSGAVIGKLIAENPDAKKELSSLGKIISEKIAYVNSLSIEAQKKLLEENFSGFSEERAAVLEERRKKDASGERELPSLLGDTSAVRMRMAPFPSGPLHIGNARMTVLNDEYVKKYGGRLVLFFDDTVGTESSSVETSEGTRQVAQKDILPEAYALIPESLRWLGVEWHEEFYKSDRLELFYEHAEALLRDGNAYVCTCDGNEFRTKFKAVGKECPCRSERISEHLARWKGMLDGSFSSGKAVVRIKSGMDNPDPALRDHVIMRITEKEHPRVGRKYRVWPLLEFSWAIDDHLIGSTHILRGADLVKEDRVEEIVWDYFGWKHAHFLHYGKFRLEEGAGTISKSKSKEKIRSGEFVGWDDPRTWSLQSLARRGIRPAAVRKFLLSFGMSLVDVAVEAEILYGMNRELIDPTSDRYFFVGSGNAIDLEIGADAEGTAPLHPDNPARGVRKYSVSSGEKVSLEGADLPLFASGPVRLKGLGIFEQAGEREELVPSEGAPVATIHFVPLKNSIPAKILMPDGAWIGGLLESAGSTIKPGQVVQLERFGFCRLDCWKDGAAEFWMAHK
ncbi:MAG: glutamate--tRNA ligase [archaeon]